MPVPMSMPPAGTCPRGGSAALAPRPRRAEPEPALGGLPRWAADAADRGGGVRARGRGGRRGGGARIRAAGSRRRAAEHGAGRRRTGRRGAGRRRNSHRHGTRGLAARRDAEGQAERCLPCPARARASEEPEPLPEPGAEPEETVEAPAAAEPQPEAGIASANPSPRIWRASRRCASSPPMSSGEPVEGPAAGRCATTSVGCGSVSTRNRLLRQQPGPGIKPENGHKTGALA